MIKKIICALLISSSILAMEGEKSLTDVMEAERYAIWECAEKLDVLKEIEKVQVKHNFRSLGSHCEMLESKFKQLAKELKTVQDETKNLHEKYDEAVAHSRDVWFKQNELIKIQKGLQSQLDIHNSDIIMIKRSLLLLTATGISYLIYAAKSHFTKTKKSA